jgi:hypothetical protein
MAGSSATAGVDDWVDVRGSRPVMRWGSAQLDWRSRTTGNRLLAENGWRSLRER